MINSVTSNKASSCGIEFSASNAGMLETVSMIFKAEYAKRSLADSVLENREKSVFQQNQAFIGRDFRLDRNCISKSTNENFLCAFFIDEENFFCTTLITQSINTQATLFIDFLTSTSSF